MATKHHTAILAAIRSGQQRRSIAFRFGVPIELVSEIATAAKAVREFRRRNVEPRVLYAVFQDLLSKQECGVTA